VIFKQYVLGCLSQLSYLIGDETSGRAVVVDPHRDVSAYLDDAAADGLRIERVIETHCHADFLSGHLELAAAGAAICYGEGAQTDFEIEHLADGQRFDLGMVWLEIRATPGHTPESISMVVYERSDDDVPYGVLTGDALFIGDVGRPDLLSSAGVSPDSLARALYHSLWDKLLTLPDTTRLFPAHGAGSACGKNMSSETSSTIGEQRRTNYALAFASEDEFVAAVTEGQPLTPPTSRSTRGATARAGPFSMSTNHRPRCRSRSFGSGRSRTSSCSTLGSPSTSPRGTCPVLSTSASLGGSPSTPAT
jgi:hydroxyacylglutathione hydrolase